MKRNTALLICVYLCLLAAFSCGLGELLFVDKEARPSRSENRMLAAFPVFSAGTVADGSFMDGFESYLSDAFFFRDAAADFSDGVKGLFRLSSYVEPDDFNEMDFWELNEEDQRAIDEMLAEPIVPPPELAPTPVSPEPAPEPTATPEPTPEAALPMETPAAIVSEMTPEPAPEATPASTPEPTPESTPAPAGPVRLATPEVTQDASFRMIREDGSDLLLTYYPAEHIAALARSLNELRAALPADGSVSLVTPMWSATANELLYYHRAVDFVCDLDEVIAPYLAEGVRYFDQADIIRPYYDSLPLYPTIDHHWHPVCSKLVLSEMLREQGVVPNGYGEYLYWLDNVRTAGPFTAPELETVTRSSEQVPVLLLNAPAESYIVTDMDHRDPGVLVDRRYDGYGQYFGGTQHPWREFVTGFHTGRNAMVIGDSFDLVFIAYLFPYYDEILVTDIRDGSYTSYNVGGNILDYASFYDISDVYIVYGSYDSINSDALQDRLERYLFRDFS